MIAHKAKLRKLGFIELPSTGPTTSWQPAYLAPNIGVQQAIAKANRSVRWFFRQ